ncbi:MAG: hypothetical protein R6V45_07315 [Oceanipulchritudo sp.]
MDDRQKARDFIPAGGPLTRRIIVVAVLFAVFIAPFVLAAFFPQTPVFYAYAEKSRGFLFIFEAKRQKLFDCRALSGVACTIRGKLINQVLS